MWNKKDKNDLYFEILEKCANNGVFDTISCMPEIKRYLIKAKVEPASNWYDITNMLLEPLKEVDYIHFIRFGQSEKDMETIPDNWMDKLSAIVSIKPKGLLFLYEKRKIEQTALGNKLTRWYIFATVIIGLCTLGVLMKGVLITIKDDDYKVRLKELQADKKRMEQHIQKLQTDSVHLSTLYHNKVSPTK
ncbi:MAG TPA: hypothetical protein VIJ57_09595 [Hanamia sp.]